MIAMLLTTESSSAETKHHPFCDNKDVPQPCYPCTRLWIKFPHCNPDMVDEATRREFMAVRCIMIDGSEIAPNGSGGKVPSALLNEDGYVAS